MPTFATPGPVAATVQVAGARVRITATDRTDTVVLVEPGDPASRSDVNVANGTKVGFAAGQLSVKTTVSGDRCGSVVIAIDVPARSGLVVYMGHSDVHADGVLGGCELHMAKGRAWLERIDTLQANIADGEVVVGHIAGRAAIEGGVAAVRIGKVDGPVALLSTGGETWIGHACADLDLTSADGSFDIDRADGSATAKTSVGAIRFGRLTRGQAKLSNHAHDIEVGISENAVARVDAKSRQGSVHDSVSSRASDAVSGDKVTVHARTRHGDIIIHRAVS